MHRIDRPLNRLTRLFLGLFLYGIGIALIVRARLGLDAWNVLHEGLAERTGWAFGQVVIGTAVLVMLAWIPLRQRPGVGTLANVVVVGLVVDAALWLLPAPGAMWARVGFLLGSVVVTAIATGLYLGAGLGPGPRDGLMTGWARRGHSIRLTRTVIEVSVLVVGVLLGGTLGIGTIVFTLTIGPSAHWFLPRLALGPAGAPAKAVEPKKASNRTWTRNSSARTVAASSPPSSATGALSSPPSPTCGSQSGA